MSSANARDALTSMRLILFQAKSRPLTDVEKNDLYRLCTELDRGVSYRPIYTHVARQFCRSLQTYDDFGSAKPSDVEELLKEVDSLTLIVG